MFSINVRWCSCVVSKKNRDIVKRKGCDEVFAYDDEEENLNQTIKERNGYYDLIIDTKGEGVYYNRMVTLLKKDGGKYEAIVMDGPLDLFLSKEKYNAGFYAFNK